MNTKAWKKEIIGIGLGWILIVAAVAGLIWAGSGCAVFGSPTPSKAWSVALTSYTAAAQGATAYCAQPQADQSACTAAAGATLEVDKVVLVTKAKLSTGTISDAELAAATSTVQATIPLLQRAGSH